MSTLRGLVCFVSFVGLYPGVDMYVCSVLVGGVPAVLPRLRNKQTNKQTRTVYEWFWHHSHAQPMLFRD